MKFTDAELIGVPKILVAGRRAAEGVVELKDRRTGEREELTVAEAVARLRGSACGGPPGAPPPTPRLDRRTAPAVSADGWRRRSATFSPSGVRTARSA